MQSVINNVFSASDRRLGAPPPVGMKERYKLRLAICGAFGKVASGIGSQPVNTPSFENIDPSF
jgi:hypothetical protein